MLICQQRAANCRPYLSLTSVKLNVKFCNATRSIVHTYYPSSIDSTNVLQYKRVVHTYYPLSPLSSSTSSLARPAPACQPFVTNLNLESPEKTLTKLSGNSHPALSQLSKIWVMMGVCRIVTYVTLSFVNITKCYGMLRNVTLQFFMKFCNNS